MTWLILKQPNSLNYVTFELGNTFVFRKLLSVYVFSYFPFGFEGRMMDLIASVPEHCLSFYFSSLN